ncbi:hypothetical protein P691DRAFT_31482 [Macrolepiota fuliginosa MF-IS2]|uniref:Uncharacterized protein n=1 Tax=Macrolepiota fuliginosa MF-IS2 TaxID=1400762 RepID=A0A9P5XC79_9AGAR|nr:hypothetical protein P691DRAFT_31482 [Macrolepiota fuliginosa MF-IS2]
MCSPEDAFKAFTCIAPYHRSFSNYLSNTRRSTIFEDSKDEYHTSTIRCTARAMRDVPNILDSKTPMNSWPCRGYPALDFPLRQGSTPMPLGGPSWRPFVQTHRHWIGIKMKSALLGGYFEELFELFLVRPSLLYTFAAYLPPAIHRALIAGRTWICSSVIGRREYSGGPGTRSCVMLLFDSDEACRDL